MSVEEKLQVTPPVVHSQEKWKSQYSEPTDNSHFATTDILNIVKSLKFSAHDQWELTQYIYLMWV